MPILSETKVFECENGKRYLLPANHCVFCKHCTDIFYDYGGPYMSICSEGNEDYRNCSKFEPDEPDPDLVKVVRCKNCAHRDKAGLCQAEGQKLTIVKDDHFCGKGERRDNND